MTDDRWNELSDVGDAIVGYLCLAVGIFVVAELLWRAF